MIHGNQDVFALYTRIHQRLDQDSLVALGQFNIYIQGTCYGVRSEQASFLACSADELAMRISNRGLHIATFAHTATALQIATAFSDYFFYGQSAPLGLSRTEFKSICFQSPNRVKWIPDGDTAFDDGSHIFHFDISSQKVRIVGFRRIDTSISDLEDVSIDSDYFYSVLTSAFVSITQ